MLAKTRMVWLQQQQYLHGRSWSRPSTLLLLLLLVLLVLLLGAAVEVGTTSVKEDHRAGAVWDTTATTTAAATYDESTKPTRGAAGGRHLRRQVLSSEKKDFAAADRSLSDTATNTTISACSATILIDTDNPTAPTPTDWLQGTLTNLTALPKQLILSLPTKNLILGCNPSIVGVKNSSPYAIAYPVRVTVPKFLSQ